MLTSRAGGRVKKRRHDDMTIMTRKSVRGIVL
nr:MAG TPA_asm: hypothetical protein [Caudoviricetes sp.]